MAQKGKKPVNKKSKSSTNRPHVSTPYKSKWLPIRLVPHKHTGKRLPFYCTSYAAIYFLLIFVGLFTIMTTNLASAVSEDGSISVGAVVKGPPPELAATIDQQSETRVTTSKFLITGTCLQDTYVEIYRNKIFAGMVICSNESRYSINISLLPEKNTITAKTRDNLGQYGPDSKPVIIFYDGAQDSDSPLIIYTDPSQLGSNLTEKFSLKYTVIGGKSPYTVSVNWGDDSPDDLVALNAPGEYKIDHKFIQVGANKVKLNVLDKEQNTSSTQTVVIVNGQTAAIGKIESICADEKGLATSLSDLEGPCIAASSTTANIVDKIWPVVIGAGIMTASFWLGEQVVIHKAHLKKSIKT